MPSVNRRLSEKIVNSKKTGPARVTYNGELLGTKGRKSVVEVSKKVKKSRDSDTIANRNLKARRAVSKKK